MSFNTSNIQCDTLTGVYSLHTPITYIGTSGTTGGIPISKNGANLKLGDVNNSIVECLELEVGTQISSPLGVISSINTGLLVPSTGTTGTLELTGNLDLTGNMIKNLGRLSLGASGATGLQGQVLSVGATGYLEWKTDANDVANWSNYQAVSEVNINNNDISNANIITTFNLTCSSLGCTGQIDAVDYNGQGQFSNKGNFQIVNSNDILVMVCDAEGNSFYSSSKASWGGFSQMTLINPTDEFFTLSAGVSGYAKLNKPLDMDNNAIINCPSVVIPYDYTFYVSKSGNDNNNGSQGQPFLTIQKAINEVETLTTSNNEYYFINVMGGSYNENLTITKKMVITGQAQSPAGANVNNAINGNISINVNSNASSLFNNFVILQGLLITGKVSFTSSEDSGLVLNNSYIYTNDDADGCGLLFSPTATNSRLRLWNSQIISSGVNGLNPLLSITKGSSCILNNCYFSGKGLQPCLQFSGNATCDTITNIKFENGNTSASVEPLVKITNSGTFSFNQCAFFYASATNKSANASASGILCNSVSGNPNVLCVYSTFYLLGTNNSNFAIQDLQHGTAPTQMLCLYYMNGANIGNAFSIRGNQNQTKFQLQVVS